MSNGVQSGENRGEVGLLDFASSIDSQQRYFFLAYKFHKVSTHSCFNVIFDFIKAPAVWGPHHKIQMPILIKNFPITSEHHKHFGRVASAAENDDDAFLTERNKISCYWKIKVIPYNFLQKLDHVEDD